jgi:N-dimethylarginine dimethylaminohydrolase
MIQQSANAVVMIRPFRFYPNPETASDNAFQREAVATEADTISRAAQTEFDQAVEVLRTAGVTVHVFADTALPEKPDAVFPNNWFSTHHDGRVALYPMYSPARRNERRRDVIDELRKSYRINALVDYSPYEQRGLHLEGTGSLVLDYVNRIAFVSLSKRSDRALVEIFCQDFAFEPILFESVGDDGRPIYHTNVVMCDSSPPAGSKREESDRVGSGSNRKLCRQRARIAQRFREAAGFVESCRRGADHGTAERDRRPRPACAFSPSHHRTGRRQRALHVGRDSSAASLSLDRRRLQTLKIGRHTSPKRFAGFVLQ